MFINVGVNRHMFTVSIEALEAAEAYVTRKPDPVLPEFSALAEHVMEEHEWQKPSSAFAAKELYLNLLQAIEV